MFPVSESELRDDVDSYPIVVTPEVAARIAELTHRRFVALYPIGFDIIVCDDGRNQFRVWDDEGQLAGRLDVALASAPRAEGAGANWAIYDQATRYWSILPAAVVRRSLSQQIPPR